MPRIQGLGCKIRVQHLVWGSLQDLGNFSRKHGEGFLSGAGLREKIVVIVVPLSLMRGWIL